MKSKGCLALNRPVCKSVIVALRLVAAIFLMLVSSSWALDAAPIEEIRGVWVHLDSAFSADPEIGKRQQHDLVDRLARAHFNLILPWVKSEYIAALTEERYADRIPVARWDALGELIKTANDKGLAVHLWYSFTHYKVPTSPDFDPANGGNPSWAARSIDELLPLTEGGPVVKSRMTDVCPMRADARKWQVNFMEQILERYPQLSGIHVEEPGYGYIGDCVCDHCLRLFELIFGLDGSNHVMGPQAEDLRCLGTTDVIRSLRTRLKERKPRIILSVNGGCSWQHDRRIGRDWRRWAQLGWLDFYAALNYQNDMEYFNRGAQKVIADLGQDCSVAMGIGVHKCSSELIVEQIDQARLFGAKGVILFHWGFITDELLNRIGSGPFSQPANLPLFNSANTDGR